MRTNYIFFGYFDVYTCKGWLSGKIIVMTVDSNVSLYPAKAGLASAWILQTTPTSRAISSRDTSGEKVDLAMAFQADSVRLLRALSRLQPSQDSARRITASASDTADT